MYRFLETGAEPRKKLDGLEKKIADLKASIDDVRNAPVSIEDVRERVKQKLVDEMYSRTPENDFLSFTQAQGGFATLPASIGMAQLCYLHGLEAVLDLIMGRIKASRLSSGIPLADRPKKIAALQVQLRQAQVDAELERLRLEAAGHKILPSVDADPAVLLELWADLPAA